MIDIQSIENRPNWERRVGSVGMVKEKWNEGKMAVLLPSYLEGLGQFIYDSCTHVISETNQFFSKPAGPIPDYPALSSTALYNATAKSWAKQEESLPIRLDIAAMKDGSFRLLAAKADELTGVTQVLNAAKAWFLHHYEGDPSVYQVNYLKETFASLFEPYGTLSGRRSIFGANIAVDTSDPDSEVTGRFIANYFDYTCGILLSEHGIEDVGVMTSEKLSCDEGLNVTIKVPSWKSLLEAAVEGSFWPTAFENPGLNVMQPAWTYVVDNLLDAADEVVNADEVSKVLNVWTDIHGRFPHAGMVASEFKVGYDFNDTTFYPVVVISPTEE